MTKLRIGFVPEHFSTPLHFAQKHFNLDAEFIPFPTGTGALAAALKEPDRAQGIDVAIGLTEGFVADLAKAHSGPAQQRQTPGYGLVGTYVESPLCWAISTGANRAKIAGIGDLQGGRVGVSRIGSGSYVMPFVLADQHGWLGGGGGEGKEGEPFEVVVIGDFAALRKGVGPEERAEFFMWEHFTTKHYWDNGELKRVGDILTPWPSWVIAARDAVEDEVEDLAEKIDQGVKHYRENKEEAVDYITSAMHYSREDALEWMTTVRFADDVYGVEPKMVDETVAVLQKAGVLKDDAGGSQHIITVVRPE